MWAGNWRLGALFLYRVCWKRTVKTINQRSRYQTVSERLVILMGEYIPGTTTTICLSRSPSYETCSFAKVIDPPEREKPDLQNTLNIKPKSSLNSTRSIDLILRDRLISENMPAQKMHGFHTAFSSGVYTVRTIPASGSQEQCSAVFQPTCRSHQSCSRSCPAREYPE